MFYFLSRKYSRIVAASESTTFPRSTKYYSEPVLPSQVTEDNQYEYLARTMTPLWKIPYSDQLKLKLKWCHQILDTFREKLKKETSRKGKKRGVSCKVHPVKASPVTESYRNKDELNIRTGVDGNPKTVGFFVGSPAQGCAVCVRGTHLVNMRHSHMQIAQAYEHYIRSSPLPACHDFRDGGHWTRLIVRSNEAGQIMAIAVFHPQDMTPEQLDEEAHKLHDFFSTGPGSECNLTSLYFQACRHTRCTADQGPFRLLFGETHLVEELGERAKFQISPDSFFQVNTSAAAVLYNTALDMAELTSMTTLLDVCSGTGTLSILASSHVRGAVGIESVYSAVIDARNNALLNNANNVEFIPGLAEKKIPRVIDELGMASHIAVIVNPGRSGLHGRVVKTLSTCSQIKRVVYISCKADSPNTVSNFVQLCVEGKFQLTNIVPVDLFPHTLHTELIMCFDR